MRRTRSGVLVLIGVLGAVSGVALIAVFGGPAPTGADPPGNNGTVKVDGVEFDDHPDNGPHVGCIFQVDWSGFEEGVNLFAHVDHVLAVAP